MRIVHFSDWHGRMRNLPYADLYICTGDMLENYDKISNKLNLERLIAGEKIKIDPEEEALNQRKWMQEHGSMRPFFTNEQAQVVVIRGNHDFTSLKPLFADGPVFEIDQPTDIFEFKDYKIGGCRGINFNSGTWADELFPAEFEEQMRKIPQDLDLMVTHSPPWGILDSWKMYGAGPLGSVALEKYLVKNLPKLWCFGHIHESFGIKLKHGVLFSNAATGYQVIDL